MRSIYAAPWLLLLTAITSTCQQHQPAAKQPAVLQAPTGVYVGLDEMKGYPAEKPGDRWYHENIVYIRPDSLFLEGNPIVVHSNGEKGYSASDGGFYSFSGRIDTAGSKLVARLLMFQHDYLLEPIIIKDKDTAAVKNMGTAEAIRRGLAHRDSSFYKRTFAITLTPQGFDMDSVHYAPTTLAKLPHIFPIGFPEADRFFRKPAAGKHP